MCSPPMSYLYLQEQKGWCSPWLQVQGVKQRSSHLCCLLNSAGRNIHRLILHWAHLDPNDFPAVSWGMCTNVLLFSLFPSCRSRSSGCSSVESNWLSPSTDEGQHRSHSSNNVFLEPMEFVDCQASSCPIHRCHGGFTAVRGEARRTQLLCEQACGLCFS